MLRAALLVASALTGGCAAKPSEQAPAASPPIAPDAPPAVHAPVGPYDPNGTHLDDDVPEHRPQRPSAARPGRPIDVTLRSTPPGAIAAVDGTQLGPTPRYWQGDANGQEHEFTFTMKGYAFARYRFVPVSSGVVHARLTVITDEPAAVEPPMLAPPLPPPPTPVSPTDATPAPADAALNTVLPGSSGIGPQP